MCHVLFNQQVPDAMIFRLKYILVLFPGPIPSFSRAYTEKIGSLGDEAKYILCECNRALDGSEKKHTKFHLFFTLYVLHLHKYNHHQLLHTFPNAPHSQIYTQHKHMYTQSHNPDFYALFG